MSTLAEVKLWNSTIGAVAIEEKSDVAVFEYAQDFIHSGIEIAPLMMPLASALKSYRFPELSRQTFNGLPGLLADSLPDKFGNALINRWLAAQGRQPSSFNVIERLCYIGTRGMGALEFIPTTGPREKVSEQIQVDQLVKLASQILFERHSVQASLRDQNKSQALEHILQVGTSAGGARAKAIIAWNPKTKEIRSGQVDSEEGFEYWLLKFDGVSGNKDKELEDPQGYGAIEYAYSNMARDAGITMSECRLLAENGRRHFMTKRFDRDATGGKLHMQSLGAMAHFDFNLAGAYSYEQAFLVMRQLNLPMQDIEQQFRRAVFNVVARNQDDHVKNIAYLMDKTGRWSLSPAFDVTYAYQADGSWTSQHQMSLNGKRDNFSLNDFKALAKHAVLKRGHAEKILHEVRNVVSNWNDYADEQGIAVHQRDGIQNALRLHEFK